MESKEIIKSCISIEYAVATIYGRFMQYFPAEKLFWENIYTDEIEHSLWLKDYQFEGFVELLPNQDLIPDINRINNNWKFIQGIERQIMSNPVSFEDSLKMALQLEQTMVETFSNELMANIFSSDYETLNDKIIISEKLHINKIEDRMINEGYIIYS
jgi:hypothetical protein